MFTPTLCKSVVLSTPLSCKSELFLILNKTTKKKKKKKKKPSYFNTYICSFPIILDACVKCAICFSQERVCAPKKFHTCPLGKYYFCQFILLFSLFFILFMDLTALFGTINGSHYTILANLYLYL